MIIVGLLHYMAEHQRGRNIYVHLLTYWYKAWCIIFQTPGLSLFQYVIMETSSLKPGYSMRLQQTAVWIDSIITTSSLALKPRLFSLTTMQQDADKRMKMEKNVTKATTIHEYPMCQIYYTLNSIFSSFSVNDSLGRRVNGHQILQ